jgi:hypothetical protein
MAVFERVSADLPATIKTSNYTLVAPDNASEIQFQSASSLVASLPAVAEVDNGYNVIVRNIGPGALSVQPAAEQQIDGEGSLSLVPGAWRWIRNDGTTWKSIASSPEDIGDVEGPESATDNAIARFDGTTGKLIQNSTAILDDSGNLTVNGNVTATGTITGSNLSGTNTGDQTITLTGDVTGSGTGSFAATIQPGTVTLTKLDNAAKAYDFSFVAGYDSTMTLEDIAAQNYGELVIARSLTIEGEVGYIDTPASGTNAVMDVLKNGISIYTPTQEPYFAPSANTLTAGSPATTSLASGDRLTFSVKSVDVSNPGKGVRFTLKTRLA